MVFTDAFDKLRALWPTVPLEELPVLLAQCDRISVFQRVDLANASRGSENSHRRMVLALGKLPFSKQNTLTLWSAINRSEEVIAAAIDMGLTLGYHTPNEAEEEYLKWVGNGEQAERCATLVWDRATSPHIQRYLLAKTILDPVVFSEHHFQSWHDRAKDSLEKSGPDEYRRTLGLFLARCARGHADDAPALTRKWMDLLLRCAPSVAAIDACVQEAREEGRQSEYLDVAIGHVEGLRLQKDTPAAPAHPAARRM